MPFDVDDGILARFDGYVRKVVSIFFGIQIRDRSLGQLAQPKVTCSVAPRHRDLACLPLGVASDTQPETVREPGRDTGCAVERFDVDVSLTSRVAFAFVVTVAMHC
jgi:hypothetical protein